MSAIAVNVHFNVRDASLQHRDEVFICPDGMASVTGTGASNESRRSAARNRWIGTASERSGPRINDSHEVGSRRNSSQGIAGVSVLSVKRIKKYRCGRRQLGASRKSHDADPGWIDVPLLRVSADEADSLKGIVHRVGLRTVTVTAQTIPQNHGSDTVVVKKRNEVGALS